MITTTSTPTTKAAIDQPDKEPSPVLEPLTPPPPPPDILPPPPFPPPPLPPLAALTGTH